MKINFKTVMRKFLRNEDGATAIEYGLVAALIAVAIIAGANTLGKHVNAIFICTGYALEVGHEVANPNEAWERCIKHFSK